MWQKNARFCPLCGADLAPRQVEGRERPSCTQCKFVLYHNPACAAAGLVLDGPRVLLVERGIEPFRGQWAIPAGYQELDEHPRDTVQREVREETGLEIQVVSLFDVFFISEDPRKPATSVVFQCEAVGGILRAGSDVTDAAWFHLDDLPEKIAFDNRRRIFDRLR